MEQENTDNGLDADYSMGGEEQEEIAINSTVREKFIAWNRRYRFLEYVVVLALLMVSLVAHVMIPVTKRPIPRVQVPINATHVVFALDPSLSHKKIKEQVPMWELIVLSYGLPLFVHFTIAISARWGFSKRIPLDSRDFPLSLMISSTFSNFLTTFVKNTVGRFRPNFHDMCGWDNTNYPWDGELNLCTDASGELEGRKSFPSGHSSAAFSGLFLLSLYLLGRSQFEKNQNYSTEENSSSSCSMIFKGPKKLSHLFTSFAPTLLAVWIAITRSIDNWHHYSDILAGSFIGMASAIMGYGYNYGSIFSSESAGMPLEAYQYAKKNSNYHHFEEQQYLVLSNIEASPQAEL